MGAAMMDVSDGSVCISTLRGELGMDVLIHQGLRAGAQRA
ncbi:hypothetical protein CJA_0952 [Cellvibrio japonicus Ueda107]|uniref:Uncharacterized protein n=1 Tax=Cellvibrio japonicus (strain Ueda107) TaxID=498211 RepID=B3PLC7_CELJU|nr:hypothetical protein CJA_0952 [Cellvibrio japonicus Ueda107]